MLGATTTTFDFYSYKVVAEDEPSEIILFLKVDDHIDKPKNVFFTFVDGRLRNIYTEYRHNEWCKETSYEAVYLSEGRFKVVNSHTLSLPFNDITIQTVDNPPYAFVNKITY